MPYALMLLGAVGILTGQLIGVRVVSRISADTLRKAVYIMIAVSGIVNLLAV